MKKLLIAGAAVVLMAEMSVTALAAGHSQFLTKATAPQIVWRHHASQSVKYMGRGPCSMWENGYCDTTGWQGRHHNTGSCEITDGHCTSWTDADGNGVCDLCGNVVYQENSSTDSMPPQVQESGTDSNAFSGDSRNSGGYGCGSGGHHGSGHHGRGHHR